jgi:hypothetical protein
MPTTIDIIPAGLPADFARPDLTKSDTDPVTGVDIVSNEVITCLSDTADPRVVLAAVGLTRATVAGRLTIIGNCYQILRLPASPVPAIDPTAPTPDPAPLIASSRSPYALSRYIRRGLLPSADCASPSALKGADLINIRIES